jgi:hypothetical protein
VNGANDPVLTAIARNGLLPHVPGTHSHYYPTDKANRQVAMLTNNRPVVWLTSNRDEWEEPVLSVRLEANSRLMARYWPWRMRQADADRVRQFLHPQEIEQAANWFIYFGVIEPAKIIYGLSPNGEDHEA